MQKLHWTLLLSDKESPTIDFGNEYETLIGTIIQ
jgi:hypothetical protein